MKKIVKRIQTFALMAAMLLCVVIPAESVQAATGKTSIAVSSGTVNIGDSVTVTAKAVTESDESAYATMTLSYDSQILEFVSCSTTYGGGAGGSVSVSIDTFTVTFKAIAAGTSSISLTASDGVNFSSGEELDSMEGSSTSITVNNEASNNGGTSEGGEGSNEGNGTGGEDTPEGGDTNNETGGETVRLSADNSLKKLTISPGTLSPEFKGSTVNYTATVANDVTSIAIDAVTSNSKATVESVSGNTNLQVGQNSIKIVVKAENGTTATYTIKVTRQEAGDVAPTETENTDSETTETPLENVGAEDISFNNGVYRVVNQIPDEIVPSGFSKATVNYHGTDYQGLTFHNGAVSLLYLTKADLSETTGHFAIYDETRDVIYPYTRLNNGDYFVIPLMAPVDTEIPDTYTSTSFMVNESVNVSAYQMLGDDAGWEDFFRFYGVNQDGEESWYQYDRMEGTYQRCINAFDTGSALGSEEYLALENRYIELKEQYESEQTSSRNFIYVMIFVIAVFVIIIINVFLYFYRKSNGGDEIYEEPQKPVKKKAESRRAEGKKSEHKRTESKKPVQKESSVKSEKRRNIEVLDFNDED